MGTKPHNVHTFRLKAQKEILYLAQQIAQQGNKDVYLLCNDTESVEMVRRGLNDRMRLLQAIQATHYSCP
jgi:hypothetical protein